MVFFDILILKPVFPFLLIDMKIIYFIIMKQKIYSIMAEERDALVGTVFVGG